MLFLSHLCKFINKTSCQQQHNSIHRQTTTLTNCFLYIMLHCIYREDGEERVELSFLHSLFQVLYYLFGF